MTEAALKEAEQMPLIQQPGQSGAMQAFTPAQMIQVALEKEAGMETIERLLAVQERWEAGEARKAFVRAMANFKAGAPSISKNRKVRYENRNNGVTSYDHASLDHILDTVGPEMSRAGLSHSWRTEQRDGFIYVTCRLTHELGHFEETTLFGMPDNSGGKNAVQAVGSTVSYLQRYTFLAVAGLATGDMDDDGQGAAPASGSQQQNQEQESAPDFYPKEAFKENLPKWKKLVESGKKTPNAVLTTIGSKARLTEQQRQQILNLGKGSNQ